MVSILLAAYNGERYLPRQLDSLEAQARHLPELRILWQDDGSADGTATLLRQRTAPGSIWQAGTQQGQHLGAAGNFLSLMAQDDAAYTLLCDQDDAWQPDKAARCMNAMRSLEAQYGADTPLLVHHDCRLIGADGQLLHDSFFRHQGWDGSANTLPRLLVQNNVTGCALMVNAPLRNLVTAHAKAEAIFMHDWFIALTAAAFGRIAFISDPLVDYRQHGANVMGASRHGLIRRGMSALTAPGRARERIALTFRQARMLRDTYGEALPDGARAVIDRYLAIQRLPKLQRAAALRRGDYLMQSRITRLGQAIFT